MEVVALLVSLIIIVYFIHKWFKGFTCTECGHKFRINGYDYVLKRRTSKINVRCPKCGHETWIEF